MEDYDKLTKDEEYSINKAASGCNEEEKKEGDNCEIGKKN